MDEKKALGVSAKCLIFLQNLVGATRFELATPTKQVRDNVHRLAKLPSRDLGYKVERWEEWQGHRTTEAELEEWARNRNLNCAVNCRTVKAQDVDVEETAVVAKLVAEFERIAGSPDRLSWFAAV